MSSTPIVQPIDVVNLYSVHLPTHEQPCHPFIQNMSLIDSAHPACTFHALIDDGALANAMSEALYLRVKDTINGWYKSTRHLRMADGTVVPSLATWRGTVRFGNLQRFASFEVFRSNGDWEFLFGKPLLRTFGVVHDYTNDTIYLQGKNGAVTLPNLLLCEQVEGTAVVTAPDRSPVEQRELIMGDGKSPTREVLLSTAYMSDHTAHTYNPTIPTPLPLPPSVPLTAQYAHTNTTNRFHHRLHRRHEQTRSRERLKDRRAQRAISTALHTHHMHETLPKPRNQRAPSQGDNNTSPMREVSTLPAETPQSADIDCICTIDPIPCLKPQGKDP